MRLALSLILFLPLVSAVTFSTPENVTSGGSTTITWTRDNGDPDTISIELANPSLLHDAIAIANNVPVTSGKITVALPIVPPAGGYTIVAVQVNNINQVYGTSGAFSIAPTVTSTSSSTASSTSASSASVTGSTSGAQSSVTGSSTPSSSGSSSSASPSSFNGNGALGNYIGSGAINSIAAAVVGIIAGVVFV